ncbi:hypothetical protein FQN57_004121 [Myotisia sp. PD_48]|nr:hypothetical protein FQN57_004121 [Myotisia sp. PD_48]
MKKRTRWDRQPFKCRNDRVASFLFLFLAAHCCSANNAHPSPVEEGPPPLSSSPPSSDQRLMPDTTSSVCRWPLADIHAEYIRYPMCLETRWAVNAIPPTFNTTTTTTSSIAPGDAGGGGSNMSVTVSTAASSFLASAGPTPSSSVSVDGIIDGKGGEDTDTDSLLDNVKFLSFEEWKKENLAKAGQSAENIRGHGKADADMGGSNGRRRPTDINNLDALGEEGEIELEFGGFSTDNAGIASWERKEGGKLLHPNNENGNGDGWRAGQKPSSVAETEGQDAPRKGLSRRKDAGTTCKERFNYASFDCAATVLKTNPKTTGSSAVLIENKDSYMLSECREKDKFVILEMCDDILVDTIVLANYEFFSSIFRSFRVSVTDRYPPKQDGWKVLGTYEATNTREVQAFAVETPLIWARYLKIEFLSHYGNEFYCPVSLIRVHGTTMMEEYKNDGEAVRAEEEASARLKIQDQPTPRNGENDRGAANSDNETSVDTISNNTDSGLATFVLSEEELAGLRCFLERNETESILLGLVSDEMCAIRERAAEAYRTKDKIYDEEPNSLTSRSSGYVPQSEQGPSGSNSYSAVSTGAESQYRATYSDTKADSSTAPVGNGDSSSSSSTNASRIVTPTVQPYPSPPPTTQESFFKSVNKRLQMLETNSTLSLLYIEEQSRILRDAFNKVEKRQLAKTTAFLENLNATVLQELKEFRQQYDSLWHSVFIEFEQQRQQYHREVFAVTSQLGILADELVFQKKVSVLQSIFVLICFGLLLFSRSSVGAYLDFPRVQNIVSRTQSFRYSSPTAYETPAPSASPSPISTRHLSSAPVSRLHNTSDDPDLRHRHRRPHHRRNPSDEQTDCEMCNPSFTYSPATPPSEATTPLELDDKQIRYPGSESTDEVALSTNEMVDSVSSLNLPEKSLGDSNVGDQSQDYDLNNHHLAPS